jgi:glycine oxidase
MGFRDKKPIAPSIEEPACLPEFGAYAPDEPSNCGFQKSLRQIVRSSNKTLPLLCDRTPGIILTVPFSFDGTTFSDIYFIISQMYRFDAIIIGAGIIGCSLARELAGEGMRPLVIDRGTAGGEASSAAAGMLSPSAEAETPNALFALGRSSLQCYPSWISGLISETGMDPQYRTEGTIFPYASEAQRNDWLSTLDWQRESGVSVQEITSNRLQKLEPELAPREGAFSLSSDHQVDNRLLMHALVQSCRRRGVGFLLGKTVRKVGNPASRSWVVHLENERLETSVVVNAAGAWAGQLSVQGLQPPPVHPIKGHMLALHLPTEAVRHVIRTRSIYLVPRRNSRIIVGSTMEKAGFDKLPRAAAISALLHDAQALCPVLGQAALAETWTGLRPASLDGMPILGPSQLKGYWFAQGHFRNGILLAPITAKILARWILTGQSDNSVAEFSADRFENGSKFPES